MDAGLAAVFRKRHSLDWGCLFLHPKVQRMEAGRSAEWNSFQGSQEEWGRAWNLHIRLKERVCAQRKECLPRSFPLPEQDAKGRCKANVRDREQEEFCDRKP